MYPKLRLLTLLLTCKLVNIKVYVLIFKEVYEESNLGCFFGLHCCCQSMIYDKLLFMYKLYTFFFCTYQIKKYNRKILSKNQGPVITQQFSWMYALSAGLKMQCHMHKVILDCRVNKIYIFFKISTYFIILFALLFAPFLD